MVFTDPPYGVSYKARGGDFEVIEGDDKRDDELYGKLLLPAFKHLAAHAASSAAFYVWHASSTREDFAQALKAAGLVERQYLIWAKIGPVLGHSDYRWQHEPCFYASRDGVKPTFYGDRTHSTVWRAALRTGKDLVYAVSQGLLLLDGAGGTMFVKASPPAGKKVRKIRLAPAQVAHLETGGAPGTVWEVGRDGGDYQHPTQKPVELAVRAIENSSKPGEVVVDAFLGSGTTLLGAELRGRRCYGLELDPQYVDVIVRRWEQATGRKAERRPA